MTSEIQEIADVDPTPWFDGARQFLGDAVEFLGPIGVTVLLAIALFGYFGAFRWGQRRRK